MPTFYKKKNNAKGAVSVAILSGDLSVTLETGDAAGFPQTGTFRATMHSPTEDPETGEIVTAAYSSGETFTIVRAQENTTAQAWSEGTVFRIYITAGQIEQIEDAINNLQITALVRNEVPVGSVNGTNTAFTTAATFSAGSLSVFQNGIRLKGGGVDYTEGTQAFTMVTAPSTGDLLLVDYNYSSGTFSTGSTSFYYNEVPSGTVNGTNTTFTLARAYVAGSTMVFRDGQLMQPSANDYSETTPGSGVITFVTAPQTGSTITVSYQSAISTTGNADTLDGYHAADLVSWLATPGTLTYSSADAPTYVVTTSVDMTATICVGMKMRVVQGATTLYLIVTAISATTITLYGGTDYVVANAAITAAYYSPHRAPIGFPMDPLKWSVIVSSTTRRTQSSPVNGTWYNGENIIIPIGSWRTSYQVDVNTTKNAATVTDIYTTLSTANNSESDTSYSTYTSHGGASGTQDHYIMIQRQKDLLLAAKTTYYLNMKSSTTAGGIEMRNDIVPCRIQAICNYL